MNRPLRSKGLLTELVEEAMAKDLVVWPAPVGGRDYVRLKNPPAGTAAPAEQAAAVTVAGASGEVKQVAKQQTAAPSPTPAPAAAAASAAAAATTSATGAAAPSSAGLYVVPAKRVLEKTKLCYHFSRGGCPAGDTCRFAHGVGELRTVKQARAIMTAAENAALGGGAAVADGAVSVQDIVGMLTERWKRGDTEPLLANLGDELKRKFPGQFRRVCVAAAACGCDTTNARGDADVAC
jgi:hypothetical protein